MKQLAGHENRPGQLGNTGQIVLNFCDEGECDCAEVAETQKESRITDKATNDRASNFKAAPAKTSGDITTTSKPSTALKRSPRLVRHRAGLNQTVKRERETDRQIERKKHKDRAGKRQRNSQTDRHTNRHTNRQTEKETGRQADRQTNRQRDKQTDRQIDRQTEKQTDRQTDRQSVDFGKAYVQTNSFSNFAVHAPLMQR